MSYESLSEPLGHGHSYLPQTDVIGRETEGHKKGKLFFATEY